MIKKSGFGIFLLSLICINASCSKSIPDEQLRICNQLKLEHTELLRGFENATLIVAENVGESYYSSKKSVALAEIPSDAFYCEWKTEPTEKVTRYNYVNVIFVPDVGIDKLLWLSESQILEDRTRRTIRRFDYSNSSFEIWK